MAYPLLIIRRRSPRWPPAVLGPQKHYLNERLVVDRDEPTNNVPVGLQHLSLDPHEGGGIPPPPHPSPERARARFWRLGVSKHCQNGRSTCRSKLQRCRGDSPMTIERVRGTLSLTHPSPKGRAPASGGRGSAKKTPENQVSAIITITTEDARGSCIAAKHTYTFPPPLARDGLSRVKEPSTSAHLA